MANSIDIYRGQSKSLLYTFVDASTSAAINILSDSFRFMVKRSREDEDTSAYIDLTTTAMTLATNTVAINLTPSMTNIATGDYTYGLKWKKQSTSAVTTIVEDLFRVRGATPRAV